MAQFLNLEGRDTFAATENIEKVKILNGGIPQNSDLNEQSAIDELRAKRIVADGFGDGKLTPVDFLMSSEGITKLKFTRDAAMPTDIYGRLYQDGNRFELRSTLSEIVIALSTNTDKHVLIPTPGSGETYRGRVYVVHAKQDYLDPAKKLTVRDRAENSIQINTASREKRVYDFFIDWGTTITGNPTVQADFPARLDRFGGEETFILDGAAGHVFEGLLSFADSDLYGFEGQLYFVGTVLLTTAGLTVDISASEVFKGKPRVTQYTGGDLWHRQDTELAGLVYQRLKSEWAETPAYNGLKSEWAETPAYNGLQVSEYTSATADFSHTVNVPATPSDYISTWHFHKLSVHALQESLDELLHIPSLNAYFAMAANLLIDIWDVGTSTDVDKIKAVLNDLTLESGNELSTHILALVVCGDPSLKASYHIIDLGSDGLSNHADIHNTHEQFVLCTFRLIVEDLDVGTHEADIIFTHTTEEVPPSYITDRRRYQINSPLAIGSPTEDVQIPLGEVFYRFASAVSFSEGTEVLIYSVGEATQLIGQGTVTYVYDGSTRIRVALTYGVDRLGYTDDVTLVNIADSLASFTSQSIKDVPNQESPDINMHVAVGRDIHAEGATQQNHTKNDDTNVVTAPITLSSSLARIRGAFAALLPSAWQSVFNDLPNVWNRIHVLGIRLPFIQMYRPGVAAQIDFVPPTSDVTNSTLGQINFNYGITKTFKKGLQRFITMYRTLCDDSGYKNPMIYMLGTSTANLQWASFMEINHSGNNSTVLYPATGAAALLGGMIALRGKNSIVACEYGADYRTRNPLSSDAAYQKAVVIDGQTGEAIMYKLRAQYAEITNLSVLGDLAVTGSVLTVGTTTGSTGLVKLEAANTAVPTSILSIKNDAGASLEVTATKLRALTDGSVTALHSHPSGSVQYNVPVGTIIASAAVMVAGKLQISGTDRDDWLFCGGAEVLIADYPILAAICSNRFGTASTPVTHFVLPDLRGEFLRGVDHARGVDLDSTTRTPVGANPADGVGSVQTSAFKKTTSGNESATHTHQYNQQTGDEDTGETGGSRPERENLVNSGTESATHTHVVDGGSDNETHPHNVYIEYYIKALEG